MQSWKHSKRFNNTLSRHTMLLWLQFLTTFLVSLYSTFLIATHLKKHFYLVAIVWEASEYGNFIKTYDWSGHLKKRWRGGL